MGNNEIQVAPGQEPQPYCLLMKNGLEVWLNQIQAAELAKMIAESKEHRMITYADFEFNTAEHNGIWPHSVIFELQIKKEGGFRCRKLKMHRKGETCDCNYPKMPKPKQT